MINEVIRQRKIKQIYSEYVQNALRIQYELLTAKNALTMFCPCEIIHSGGQA